MERFCGHIQRSIRSRRYPWSEIDNYVKYQSQLRIISLKYNLGGQLNLARTRREDRMSEGVRNANCMSSHFMLDTIYDTTNSIFPL